MRYMSLFILSVLFLTNCNKIRSLEMSVINAIHIKDINLIDTDLTTDNMVNYFYSKNMLYISDNIHKKIFALNSYNKIVFELGNIFDTSTQKQNESAAWEVILEEMKQEFNIEMNTKITKDAYNNGGVKTNIREFYPFEDIKQIVVDNKNNLYVSHIFFNKVLETKQMEILKFSPEGKFLYTIGEEGRDNPAFNANVLIQNFYFDIDNGLWIKYLEDDKQFLRYYSGFGKNILFFSEENIIPVIENFLFQDNKNQKYTIEDIYPINNTRDIMVILDIYEEKEGQYSIIKKQIITFNKQYVLQDIVSLKKTNLQIYGMSNNNEFYGLTYQDKEGYLLETYDIQGNLLLKSKFNPEIDYYTRLNVSVQPDGGVLGVFLKFRDLVFMLWR